MEEHREKLTVYKPKTEVSEDDSMIMQEQRKKLAICKPRRKVSEDDSSADSCHLTFLVPRSVRNFWCMATPSGVLH